MSIVFVCLLTDNPQSEWAPPHEPLSEQSNKRDSLRTQSPKSDKRLEWKKDMVCLESLCDGFLRTKDRMDPTSEDSTQLVKTGLIGGNQRKSKKQSQRE